MDLIIIIIELFFMNHLFYLRYFYTFDIMEMIGMKLSKN